MSNRNIVIFSLVLITVGFYAVTSSAQLTLGTACEPYGSISIKSQPAADNIPVVAYINGLEFARCMTHGGQYSLYIEKDNPDTPEKEGWADGDNVVIHVNSYEATPTFPASAGRVRKDLSINTLDVQLNTWGKIKALFK